MTGGAAPSPLAPGLYFVSTPIGNARDVTLRALDILRDADVLAAEDTRSLRRLMEIHGIPLRGRRLVAYHDQNGPKTRPALLARLAEGRSVAYAPEAGTPLVSDPGFVLARAAIGAGHTVTAAPGASAPLAALAVAGLPSDRFTFAGFPPHARAARLRFLEDLKSAPGTLILFESPRRIVDLLVDAAEVLGADRPAALSRELTKKFEETLRDSLGALAEAAPELTLKGEMVLCIGVGENAAPGEAEVREALEKALKSAHLKDAAQEVAERFGLPRRDVYQLGLTLKDPE
ncbi:MAG: 16S rRNA (cytidine(1402)-2'-O)-methyltransferase [Paracoccaceae bacterium]|nr:16S rRNA (cytidine(1402)-2'-O)-methyltransferase [Paracoccaceae bacterium]